MASAPIHHGLIAVPFVGQQHGIYWLRLYALEAGSFVAIVTEVPGNPGPSITNGISRIFEFICKNYKVGRKYVELFQVWPCGSIGNRASDYKRVTFSASPEWHPATRRLIEGLIESRLPKLPKHGELYKQVLALGGGVHREIWQPIFEAVSVAEFPPPHSPANCRYIDRFRQIAASIEAEVAGGSHDDLEAGRCFLATLSPEDRASCRYHRANWKAIADESVRILEQLGRCDPEDYIAQAERSHLSEDDRRWLVKLFMDSIRIRNKRYSNGQHRACALRFSGANRAVIEVNIELLGEETEADWTYEGGG